MLTSIIAYLIHDGVQLPGLYLLTAMGGDVAIVYYVCKAFGAPI